MIDYLILALLVFLVVEVVARRWPAKTPPVVVVPVPVTLGARAKALVTEQNTHWPDRDGEAKRHQVYARLIKEFPDVSRRTLSRAIEDSLGD